MTRYGRVLFYDYDEVEYLTDCVFREIPPPPTPEAELAEEVWYRVGPHDVFPEEFGTFLLGDARVRQAFVRHHADLLGPEFWRDCQRRVAEGEIVDFFPYREAIRFSRPVRRPRARRGRRLVGLTGGARAEARDLHVHHETGDDADNPADRAGAADVERLQQAPDDEIRPAAERRAVARARARARA